MKKINIFCFVFFISALNFMSSAKAQQTGLVFASYRLTFILGITNIIGLLLVFFSCRCLVGRGFVKKMWQYKWYQKFYNLHCYYWWFFFISVFLHSIVALLTFGIPAS